MSASPNLPKPSLATLRVSQGVSQGLLIKRVQPKYPPAALAAHTQGVVQIEATINKEGNVINLKVLSGDPVLAQGRAGSGPPVEIQAVLSRWRTRRNSDANHDQFQNELASSCVRSQVSGSWRSLQAVRPRAARDECFVRMKPAAQRST